MTRIIITRHGETDWNAQGRIQGTADIPLNENGIAQALQLAESLSKITIHAIYTSEYQRAAETARLIQQAHPDKPQLTLSKDIRERSWGVIEGLSWEEIERIHPDAARGINSGALDYVPPGGESKRDAFNRTRRLLRHIARRHPDQFVLIVTHRSIAATLLKYAMNIGVEDPTPFRMANCALYIIDTPDGEQLHVQNLNDRALTGTDPP